MAGRITMAQYQKVRAEAVANYAAAASTATLAAGAKVDADKVTAGTFMSMGRAWLSAPASRLRDSDKIRDDIITDFEAAKTATKKRVVAAHKEQVKAGIKPALSEDDARKNSTKGIRQRRPVLENLLECISLDPQLARDAFAKDSGLSWTQVREVLEAPLVARVTADEKLIFVGTDEDGGIHHIGHDYKKMYDVTERAVADGSIQEHITLSVGPKGSTEDLEVVVSKAPSGPLYAEAREAVILHRKLSRSRHRLIRTCEEAARLPEFMIPESAPKSDA